MLSNSDRLAATRRLPVSERESGGKNEENGDVTGSGIHGEEILPVLAYEQRSLRSQRVDAAATASSSRCETAALEQLPVGSALIRQDLIAIRIVGHDKNSRLSSIFAILSMATRGKVQSDGEHAQK